MFDPPPPRNYAGQKFGRDKRRYGWSRLYNDFTGHPKWRRVAVRSGVHLAFVHTIAIALFNSAAKARNRGWIGNIDFEDVAAATDIPTEQVAIVFRVLEDIGWIEQDHIADWLERQPLDEDPTSADRQRNKRAKDRAKRAAATGTATSDDLELLTVAEREALDRLAKSSRVTSEPPQQDQEMIRPFVSDRAHGLNPDGVAIVRLRNDLAARHWLIGKVHDNTHGTNYGPASKIVADNFGCNRLNADGIIRRWLTDQMEQDHTSLATIISSAFEQSINNEAFRNVVESRITAFVRERTQGASLPLGMTAITGGRS